MKTVLIIIGVLLLLGVSIVVIGGSYFASKMGDFMEETQAEATKFAENATKEDCLEKYVADYKACEGITCYGKTASFGVMCLAEAKGNIEAFCKDKPKSQAEVYGSTWNKEFCKARGLDNQDCVNVYKIIETQCTSQT